MTIRLEGTGYRKVRGDVVGTVRALDVDRLIFADGVNLTRAKSRSDFIRELRNQQGEAVVKASDLDRALLRLLEAAEMQLASEPAPSAPSAADDEERIEDYAVRNGRYEAIRMRETIAGPIETRVALSNFTAKILEDIAIDDGAEETRYFVIEGRLDGRPLTPVRVPAGEFGKMQWVVDAWGARVRVLPGLNRKDLLRDAIQAFSSGASRRTIYAHSGWRRIDGRWVFLHGGGAIGADGPLDGIAVELDGKLALYRLRPPVDATLREDVRASWDLWNVAPDAIAAPLGGVVYGAPLAEWLRPAFTLWMRGKTGSLKTTLVTLALSHVGEFDVRSVPANWEATANYLEKYAFQLKDLPLLIDDYRPASDRHDAGEMRRKAQRIIRAAGNRAGRGRMRADTSLRPEYYPRGVVIATAEEQAPGESTAARVWDVDFSDANIDKGKLTPIQGRSEPLKRAMGGYIRWLAGRLERDSDWLQKIYSRASVRAQGLGGHLRHPQTLAYLLTSWVVFAEFAEEVGAITAQEALDGIAKIEAALRKVAERQAEVALGVRPDVVFIRTLRDLLGGGKAYLAALSGGAPPDAQVWGWEAQDEGGSAFTASRSWRPKGEKLGWVDDECVYLNPSQARRLVAKTVAEQGDSFIISPQALGELLERGGYLRHGNKGRHHTKKAEGASRDTICLTRRALEGCLEEET